MNSAENSTVGGVDVIDLREYWRAIVAHRKLISIITASCVLLALVFTLLLRPMYQASALLEITDSNSNMVNFQNIESVDVGSEDYMVTQSRVLESEAVATRVVKELGLIDNPEFNGELTQRGLISGVKAFIRQVLPSSGAEEPTEASRIQSAVEVYLSRLSVAPVRKSSLISVSFESFSPELAMQITNAHVQAYVDFSEDRRFNSTSGAKRFLEKEIGETQARLETAERKLTEFARKYGVVDVEDRNNVILERLSDLNITLAQVQAKRIDAESQYRQSQVSDTANLASAYDNPLISSLKEELAANRAEYFDKLQVYKPQYPLMQQLQARADQIQAAIDEQTSKIESSYEGISSQLNDNESSLREAIDTLNAQLLDLQDRAVSYNILKRELEADKEIYAGLLERTKEVGVVAGMELNLAQIVDPATLPKNPSSPNLPLNLLLSAILGLMAGVGVALLLKLLDNTIASPDQVQRVTGLSQLGLVPALDQGKTGELRRGESMIPNMLSMDFAEAVQSIRTSLAFSRAGGLPKSIMLTSSIPGEGKSTLAMSLASSFAVAGKRVIFVEADIRRESQASLFGLSLAPGLSDYLSGQSKLKIHNNLAGVDGLDLVVGGTQVPNTVNLLESQIMVDLINNLESEYDLVVIDAPPVIGLADAPIISQQVASVVFVVAAHNTPINAIENSLGRLRSVQAPLTGVILNKFDHEGSGYGYSNYAYYGLEDS